MNVQSTELLKKYHVRYILSSPYEDQEYHDPTRAFDFSKLPGDDFWQAAKSYALHALAPEDRQKQTEHERQQQLGRQKQQIDRKRQQSLQQISSYTFDIGMERLGKIGQ